jgi:hypothetical protein
VKKRWIRIRYIRNGRSSECRSRRSFIKFSWINKTFQQRENIAISKRKNTKANFLTVPFGTKFYYSLDSTQIHFANKNKIYNSEIQNTHSSYLKHTHTHKHIEITASRLTSMSSFSLECYCCCWYCCTWIKIQPLVIEFLLKQESLFTPSLWTTFSFARSFGFLWKKLSSYL